MFLFHVALLIIKGKLHSRLLEIFFSSLQEFIFFHSVWMYVGLLFNIHSSAVLHTLSHSHIISFYSLISVIK